MLRVLGNLPFGTGRWEEKENDEERLVTWEDIPGLRTKETSEKFPAKSMSKRQWKSVMCNIQFQLFPNLPRAVFLIHYLQTLKKKSIHNTNSIVLVLLLEIIEKEEWGERGSAQTKENQRG